MIRHVLIAVAVSALALYVTNFAAPVSAASQVTTHLLVIEKTAHGIRHSPPADSVFVVDGGAVNVCNEQSHGVTEVSVTTDGTDTYKAFLTPDQCVHVPIGSTQIPNGDFTVNGNRSGVTINGFSIFEQAGSLFNFK